jgi:hypothetical protein
VCAQRTASAGRSEASTEASLSDSACYSFLNSAQNEDGGWGFQPKSLSRAEPTCWALLALADGAASRERAARGLDFLTKTQLPDGSWAPSPGESVGCWVTSLACLVLTHAGAAHESLRRGLQWICEDWPRDAAPFRRWLRKLSVARSVSPRNDFYRGWGWTPGTSSWVEPTSFAVMALEQSPVELQPKGAGRRRRLAEAMLLDRMCPGGGWNCGNPIIYGVPGEPFVFPTVWALLALLAHRDRTEVALSLEWLEKNLKSVCSPASLCLSCLCLEAYGRSCGNARDRLREFYSTNEFLESVPVAAWACLSAEKLGMPSATAGRS